jgi:chitinase
MVMTILSQGLARLRLPLSALALAATCQTAAAQKKAKIFAFFGDWNTWSGISANQLEHLTHVIHFSILPPSDGNLTDEYICASEITGVNCQAMLDEILVAARKKGVKVILGVGGDKKSGNFPAMAGNAAARQRFATGIAKFCRTNGLAGIDIDWEFPNDNGAALSLLMDEVKKAFVGDLMVTLSVNAEALTKYGKASLEKADYVLVMSYDNRPPTVAVAQTDMNNTAGYVTNKSKIMLGVPFYGRSAWPGGAPLAYGDIIKANPSTSPTTDNAGGYSFNGTTTLAKKVDIAMDGGFGGMMIWELTQDHKVENPAGRLLTAMTDQIKAKGGTLDKIVPSALFRTRPLSAQPLRYGGNLFLSALSPLGDYRVTGAAGGPPDFILSGPFREASGNTRMRK